ncbi:MAG: DUF6691 family protein [Methylobacter sp.]
MAAYFSALFCGLLFGLGLVVSQMVNPGKVLGFLDVAGSWDPSLLLVMASALATLRLANLLIFRRSRPILEQDFHLPTSAHIDSRLLTGSALFGIGWGLSGLCPGPAISGLVFGVNGIYIFTGAMFIGMWLFHIQHYLKKRLRRSR